jgi:hypothetical protein
VWAGTNGLALVGALNAKAGTSGWGIKKVLNYLAFATDPDSQGAFYGGGEYGDGIYGGVVLFGEGEYGDGAYGGGLDFVLYGDGLYGDSVYGGGITAAEGNWITGKWLDAAGAASQIQ